MDELKESIQQVNVGHVTCSRRSAMGLVMHSIEKEPAHTVEIVVHISEALDERQRSNLVVALENRAGIVSAEFCQLRYHLMLVRYDRDQYSSQDVLSAVTTQKLQARLIGPV
jgi:riboflavin synthase